MNWPAQRPAQRSARMESPGRRWGRRVLHAGLGLALYGLTGCAVPVQASCPHCPLLVVGQRPPVPPGTRTVFVLMPGLLGYGWEWNGAQIALAQVPHAAVILYEWNPWTSVRAGGAELAASMQYLLRRLPRSVDKVVLITHSAAGLLGVEAAAQLRVPAGLPVAVLAIGTPLAGNYFNLVAGEDNFHSPIPLALSGKFTHWPEPAPGVELSIWPTGATDPVMKPHFGHDPADRRVLPRAARVQALPPRLDHNQALGLVARRLAAGLIPSPPPAPSCAAPEAGTAAGGDSAPAQLGPPAVQN